MDIIIGQLIEVRQKGDIPKIELNIYNIFFVFKVTSFIIIPKMSSHRCHSANLKII